MNPFDFVKSINSGKDISEDAENKELLFKGYNPFLTNKAFSYHVDTILHAFEMNKAALLSSECQYKYLLNTVRPRKRYGKWDKPEQNGDIELVQQVYNVNRTRAKVMLSLLSKEQLDDLRIKTTGG